MPINDHKKFINILLAELAARFKEDGMLAYVQLVQHKEKEIGCDVLTHQKWYGVQSCMLQAGVYVYT